MTAAVFFNNWNEAVKQILVTCGTTYTKIDLEGATRCYIASMSNDVLYYLSPTGDDDTVGIPFGTGNFSHTGEHSFMHSAAIGIQFSGDNPSLWVISDDAAGYVTVTLFFDNKDVANSLGAAVGTAEPAKQDEEKDIARSLLSGGLSGLF